MEKFYRYRLEEYDDKIQLTILDTPRIRRGIQSSANHQKADNSLDNRDKEIQRMNQMYAIRRKIKRYSFANDFTLFWTLTFNDEVINANDYQLARKKLRLWLRNQRDKYGKFGYIFIPEFHKSGRVHFHGITEKLDIPLKIARNSRTDQPIRKNGQQIFNVTEWKYGFSTVSKIKSKEKTASYITKYITKDLLQIPNLPHQPRYLVSRKLKQPNIRYLEDLDFDIRQFKPQLIIKKNLGDNENYFEDRITIYQINKDFDGILSQDNSVSTKVIFNKVKNKDGEN